MPKKFIIQKREFGEKQAKKPHLMGPYRTCYSSEEPPSYLDTKKPDKEYIKKHLLKEYGEGRYQVKSIGAEEGKRSKIEVYFSGEVRKPKSEAKPWTKEERKAYLREKYRTPKEKLFVLSLSSIFMVILIIAILYFLVIQFNPALAVTLIIILGVVFALTILFTDFFYFETE